MITEPPADEPEPTPPPGPDESRVSAKTTHRRRRVASVVSTGGDVSWLDEPGDQADTAVAVAEEPEPEPPLAFNLRADAPQPPEADEEVIAMLGELRGADAVAELGEALAVLDRDIRARVRQIAASEDVAALASLEPIVRRRRCYADRFRALAKRLNLAVEPEPEPPAIPADIILPLTRAGRNDLKAERRAEIRKLEARLLPVQRELDTLELRRQTYAARPAAWAGDNGQDGFIGYFTPLVESRRTLTARLETLRAELSVIVETEARLVAEAIEAGGGSAAVAAGLADAFRMTGRDPDLDQAEASLKGIESDLSRLDAEPGAETPLQGSLAAARFKATALVATLKGNARARLRERAAAVVAATLKGNDQARQTLLTAARAVPAALPGLAGPLGKTFESFQADRIRSTLEELR